MADLENSKNSDAEAIPAKPKLLEGSLKGWLAVLACWCIMFNTFGYINAFGYADVQNENNDQSDSNIAWIGSLQVFFMFSGGLVSGPLMDRYGPKVIIIPCSILFIVSVMLTSLGTEYYHFMLTQGVLGGVSNGLTYTPTITAVNQYFFEKRPLAMGIASSGSSLAGVIFPIALNRLLNNSELGFGWSVRILGFLMMVLSIIACASVSSNVTKRTGGPLLLWKAWKQPAYTLQITGLFLVVWAMFIPFFYIPGYAQSISIDVNMSNYLIAILNAGSLIGRLVGGVVANRLGQFNTLAGASIICGILNFCWLSIHSLGGMVGFSVLLGFSSGIVIGLFPATIAMTATKTNEIGSYLGMGLGVLSISGLTGTPITGALIHRYGSYDPAMIFAGVCSIVGAVIIAGGRVYSVQSN
ncbi:unnamed protein product [Penicillium manginii]